MSGDPFCNAKDQDVYNRSVSVQFMSCRHPMYKRCLENINWTDIDVFETFFGRPKDNYAPLTTGLNVFSHLSLSLI